MKDFRMLGLGFVLGASLIWVLGGRGPAVATARGQVRPQPVIPAPVPPPAPAQAQPSPPGMVTWEYFVFNGHPSSQQDYNKLGAQGWEMCGVAALGPGQVAVSFKRPKR